VAVISTGIILVAFAIALRNCKNGGGTKKKRTVRIVKKDAGK
jgi:hypothetical protein